MLTISDACGYTRRRPLLHAVAGCTKTLNRGAAKFIELPERIGIHRIELS
jgi:hypothetical protein